MNEILGKAKKYRMHIQTNQAKDRQAILHIPQSRMRPENFQGKIEAGGF